MTRTDAPPPAQPRERALPPGVRASVEGWFAAETRAGTLLSEEALWAEAYAHLVAIPDGADADDLWPLLAELLVFELPAVPVNERQAATEALAAVMDDGDQSSDARARRLYGIAGRHDVHYPKLLGLVAPGAGDPWMFPRALWTPPVVAGNMHGLLAPLGWEPAHRPDTAWLTAQVEDATVDGFLGELSQRAPDGSDLAQMLSATRALVASAVSEGRDFAVQEAHSFIAALEHHGLPGAELTRWHRELVLLRSAVVCLHSYRLQVAAERWVSSARALADHDAGSAVRSLRRAVNLYKRMAVARLYPERLLARHQELYRDLEELQRRAISGDTRCPHVLLVSTYNSTPDLQRLLVSIWHELTAFGYGPAVHVVISDDSTGQALTRNGDAVAQGRRAGMSISHWTTERKNRFLHELNGEVFPDGRCDVFELAGGRTPDDKGVPYGRFRNFLRLVALRESRELALEAPICTWLDQDNEIGALVLTGTGILAKRHVFNYFDQKSAIFAGGGVVVGGGGYTNDALEGVEKFWVAWGILHQTFELARQRPPDAPPKLPADADITRFRPWDQPDTLERLRREGEEVRTFADQVLLLLSTLVGTFRGKYDNQVQVFHPWTFGRVVPGDELLVEETRAFAGMPGGNTSFVDDVLASAIPFITVCGRGEDIFHLWQVESEFGAGSVHLTHTPALHSRNVTTARSDLMAEIVDSYNGRIFREPPYLWAALASLARGDDPAAGVSPDVERETADRISNLRAEAMSNIAAVSGFASALEPYLDDRNGFWWLRRAAEDPRFAQRISDLRAHVEMFRHPESYQRRAEEKLLGLDDVKELTRRFLAAYPHWRTIVEHVGGPRGATTGDRLAGAAPAFPQRGYGAPSVPTREGSRLAAPSPRAEVPAPGEPTLDPLWRDAVQSALLLFRRYETGMAANDRMLVWHERIERLSDIYHHYGSLVGDLPGHAWTTLYREALLVPHSAPHAAVSRMATEDFWSLPEEERSALVSSWSEESHVDAGLLREALAPRPATTA